jgi:hypothetical protein
MLPLIIIGALLGLGLASTKKAQAAAKPVAPSPATKTGTTVSVRTPPAKRLAARRAVIQAKKSAVQKVLESKIKKVTAKALTPTAQKALGNLIMTAANKQAPESVRKLAQTQIKKIVAQPASVRAATINALPTQAKTALAKAVINADTTTKPTATDAARSLAEWTKQGGNQGTKNNPSATVKRLQGLMGFTGKDADGIIGPKTRTRAKQLGFTLAARSAQKPGAVGAAMLGYQPPARTLFANTR